MSKEYDEKEKEKQLKVVREAIKKEKKSDVKSVKAILATREALEKDYKDDICEVKFKTPSGKVFKTKTLRPTSKESNKILSLSITASNVEGSEKEEDLLKAQSIYDEFAEIAGKLVVDETLDVDFWKSCVSPQTLINFVVGIVTASQGLSDEELKKFR